VYNLLVSTAYLNHVNAQERGMDGGASDMAAALGALDGDDAATAARYDLVHGGELRLLPRRGGLLAPMLIDAGAAAAGATARVTTTESKGCFPSAAAASPLARALASSSGPQAAQARVGTSVADLFALGTGEDVRRASAARAAGSLLRNVRVGVIETELYRLFDVTTSEYHSSQTKGVPSGHLVFVRQGKHGALSLMIVGGRAAGGPPEDEFTILIRGC
jgi:hypothetical protein